MRFRPWLAVLLSGTGPVLGLLIGFVIADNLYHRPVDDVIVPAKTATTIVATGDIACAASQSVTELTCQQAATASLVMALQPKAVLALGDLQYPSGILGDYRASYDKSWGQLKAITHPVPGNHEYQTAGAAGYFDYFGSAAGERGKGYYSFDQASWHIIALNSEIDVSDSSAQRAWLRSDLAATNQPCIMAYWHKPRFSTGYHVSDANYQGFWQDLYAAGADVVVNGHSHAYERFAPLDPQGKIDQSKGITEFVAGMGGYGSEQLSEPNGSVVARQNYAFGVLQFDLRATSLVYRFITVPGSKQFHDEGVVACHV